MPVLGNSSYEVLRARILLVDVDSATQRAVARLLAAEPVSIESVESGVKGLNHARDHYFDLLIVQERRTDKSTLGIIRELRAQGNTTPFILVTDSGRVPLTVQAMKLGAADVVEIPFEVDELTSRVLETLAVGARPLMSLSRSGSLSDSNAALTALRQRSSRIPATPIGTWLRYVIRALSSPEDIKTLNDWARVAGISYTTLREACYLLQIAPHQGRDFTRALRALFAAREAQSDIWTVLNITDRRSLLRFSQRTNVRLDDPQLTVSKFLDSQHLIPQHHQALQMLRTLLRD